jgi:hypothetical protein
MNKITWNLTKAELARLSITTLTMVVTILIYPQSIGAQDSNIIAKESAELPVVTSGVLGTNMDVPWSRPVKVRDPFEGDYLAVFDRNYFYRRFLNTNARVDVVSLWSRKSVRLLLAYNDRDCLSRYGFHLGSLNSRCLTSNGTQNVAQLLLKVGGQVFRLEGENGTFPVSDRLAEALENSPIGNVSIRLVAESGEAVDSEIGKGTVKAWKTIY